MKITSCFERILVIGPTLAEWSEMQIFSESLEFLTSQYHLELADPLEYVSADISCQDFLTYWRKKIYKSVLKYKAFVGFSLGGVILQQCFDILEEYKKPAILCSAPSFVRGLLKERLSHITNLIYQKSLKIALVELRKYVCYPNEALTEVSEVSDSELATLRISRGHAFVAHIDSRHILESTRVNYLHLIGEKSFLVGKNDVVMSKLGKLIIVPNAGMRVFQNNLSYCIDPVLQFLDGTF